MRNYFLKTVSAAFCLSFAFLLSSCADILQKDSRGGVSSLSEITLSGKITSGSTDTNENTVLNENKTTDTDKNTYTAENTDKKQRSAFPDLANQSATATIYYTVKASSQGQSEQTAEVNGNTFTIKLPLGSGQSTAWTLTAEGYSTESDRQNRTNKIVQGSKDISLTSSNPVDTNIEIPVGLSTPSQSGNGNISLKVKAESGTEINKIKATFQHESDTDIIHTITKQKYSEGQTITLDNINSSETNKNMKAGVYTCTLEFFKAKTDQDQATETEILLYKTIEKVTVVQGLTTNSWQGSSYIGSDGILTVTSEMVKNFQIKTFYVAGDGSSLQYKDTAKDENRGTWFDPLKTIQKAVDKVIGQNDGTTEYTIYVDGTFTAEGLSNNTPLVNIQTETKTLNLTIKGFGTRATLNAERASATTNRGRVINIDASNATSTSIKLENLEITGGSTANNENGAGINKTNGQLTIKNCIIKNNKAVSGWGGGIYVNGGGLVFSPGTNSTSGPTGIVEITGNSAQNGGGIYAAGSAILNISLFSKLESNTASKAGGAVYLAAGTTTTLNNCSVNSNLAVNSGGAIYITSTGTVNITGSTLKDNKVTSSSDQKAEAIYIQSNATVSLSDTEISWTSGTPNVSHIYMDGSTEEAVLKLGGNIKIPDYGININRSISKTDVPIIITKALSGNEKIKLYDNDSQTNSPIIEGDKASDGKKIYTLTQNDCDKFDGENTSRRFTLNLDSTKNQGLYTPKSN